jgi:hypothetical protein
MRTARCLSCEETLHVVHWGRGFVLLNHTLTQKSHINPAVTKDV